MGATSHSGYLMKVDKLNKLLEESQALADSKAIKNAKLILSRLKKFHAKRIKSGESLDYVCEDLEKFIAACKAPKMESVHCCVEWKRSKMWGWNPHATVRINGKTYRSHASGCGYDKLSSAIASAMQECPSCRRFIFENCKNEKAIKCYPFSWKYGLPSFSFGGCGFSCLVTYIKACGWKNQHEIYDKDGSLIGFYYSAK